MPETERSVNATELRCLRCEGVLGSSRKMCVGCWFMFLAKKWMASARLSYKRPK
jgi:hypothetical protein